jgi:hypothetical protein
MRVNVAGNIRTLEYRDSNWIDWASEFVSAGGFDRDDNGNVIMSGDDYQWWSDCIAAHKEMVAEIAAYKQRFGEDEVDQVVEDWIGVDLGDQPNQVRHGLRQAFGPLPK